MTQLSLGHDTGWRRLHPLTPLARGWAGLAVVWALLMQGTLHSVNQFAAIVGPVIIGAVVLSWVSWYFTRFRIADDALQVETGFIFRRSRRVPLARLQAIDVRRPLVARLLALADLRLEVAGGSSTEANLAYLSDADARRLRAELLARAAGLRADAHADSRTDAHADARTEIPEVEPPEAPEQVIVEVPPLALVASILLRGSVLVSVLIAVGIVVGSVTFERFEILAGAVPFFFYVGSSSVGVFIREFGFTVAVSPDGLRLRRGLVETRAQTVPPGRVQAVSVVQPPLWRLAGWVRVEVSVAGYAARGEGEAARSTGTLLPVAPRALAMHVVGLALSGIDPDAVPVQPVPDRVRWRAPLQRPYLGVGANGVVFITRYGWLTRTLAAVPHARTQSVRLTQGPWQRWLSLATVHVDVTPGPVQVAALHRDAPEAREIAEAQIERARAARAEDRSERWMQPMQPMQPVQPRAPAPPPRQEPL
jgi:putative membrane protein